MAESSTNGTTERSGLLSSRSLARLLIVLLLGGVAAVLAPMRGDAQILPRCFSEPPFDSYYPDDPRLQANFPRGNGDPTDVIADRGVILGSAWRTSLSPVDGYKIFYYFSDDGTITEASFVGECLHSVPFILPETVHDFWLPPPHAFPEGSHQVATEIVRCGEGYSCLPGPPPLGWNFYNIESSVDPDGTPPNNPDDLEVVVLGDSYSAGEGAGTYRADTDRRQIDECHRSDETWGVRHAMWLASAQGKDLDLRFVACSGARIDDLYFSNHNWGIIEPRQLDALRSTTDVVTISIGGNDVGFVTVFSYCITQIIGSCERSEKLTVADGLPGDRLDRTFNALFDDLVSAYRAIKTLAPNAVIYVEGYPNLLPSEGCWSAIAGLNDDELQYLRDKATNLNDVVEAAAARAGVVYVPAADFTDHELCSTDPWANGLEAKRSLNWSRQREAMHPKAAGYAAMATQLQGLPLQNPAPDPSIGPPGPVSPVADFDDMNSFLTGLFELMQQGVYAWDSPNRYTSDRYEPGAEVELRLVPTPEPTPPDLGADPTDPVVLGTAIADEDGRVEIPFTFPTDAPLGLHHLVAETTGSNGDVRIEIGAIVRSGVDLEATIDGPAALTAGSSGVATVTVTNPSAVESVGEITVELSQSGRMDLTSFDGDGWSCDPNFSGGTSCRRTEPIAAGATAPPISIGVEAQSSASQTTQVITARLRGGADQAHGNNYIALVVGVTDPAGPQSMVVLNRPCTIYDTTIATAPDLSGPVGSSLRTIQVDGALPTGQGGAPNCIPAEASAAVVTVATIDPGGPGNLRMAPGGQSPRGGIVNYAGNGLNNANTVTMPLSSSGQVSLQANGAPTGVRLSVIAYLSPQGTLVYAPITPCAAADSRADQGAGGDHLGPFDAQSEIPAIDVVGSFPVDQGGGNTTCGVPASAGAVMINLVAVRPQGGFGGTGYISSSSSSEEPREPITAFSELPLNNATALIVPLDQEGTIRVDIGRLIGEPSAHVRVVVLGYLDPIGSAYTPLTPCAAFDTRDDRGAVGSYLGRRSDATATTYQIAGAVRPGQGGAYPGGCGVPSGAEAALINLVAIGPTAPGNLRVYATDSNPTGGVLNFAPTEPAMNNSNAVVVPLSQTGEIDVFVNAPANVGGPTVHVRGVILGYFTTAAG